MKNFERIKKYLQKEMNEAERLSFEDEMSTDKKLAEEVKVQSFEESAFEWMLEDNLHKEIQSHRKNNPFNKLEPQTSVIPLKNRRRFWILGIAASVLLLIVALFFLNQNKPAVLLADRLIQDYPPEAGLNLVLKNTELLATAPNKLYQKGHAYFIQEDYPKAIEQFKDYLNITPENFRARQDVEYYLFLSYLKNGAIEEARRLGEKITSDATHRFQPALEGQLDDL